MKIGTYNLNNLFDRAVIFELPGMSAQAKLILDDIEKLNALLDHESYTGTTKTKLESILKKYFQKKEAGKFAAVENDYFIINQVRNKLFTVKKTTGLEVTAKGKNSWFGWIELVKENVDAATTKNTAKVIDAVNADVLCTVEVESRPALKKFNDEILSKKFAHCMVIDGNDPRGIDVGLCSNIPITKMISHVDDDYEASNHKRYTIFSRDCPEYELTLPGGDKLYVLCNHLKSQGYGTQTSNDARRKRQAQQIVKILDKYDLSNQYVVVLGDFNDRSDSDPLSPLFGIPGLHHVNKNIPGNKGTYLNGANEDIDHIFASSALMLKFVKGEIERRGIYKKNGNMFPTVKSAADQASDHAAVWAEFDIG